jgi:hypothetical protein
LRQDRANSHPMWFTNAMAILTARSVQSLLDESCAFLTAKHVGDLATRLNNPVNALAAEWELIVLSAMSYIGVVEHEPQFAGSRRIDFLFDHATNGLRIVGDITSVSDAALQRNSVDYFSRALTAFLDRNGIKGRLSIGIDCVSGENDSVLPRLPNPHEMKPHIFASSEFRKFVSDIKGRLGETHQVRIDNGFAGLSIIYSPGRWGLTMRYSDIRSPRDIERNVLFNALKDKAAQISRSGHTRGDGFRCVVLCDGDCAALTHGKNWDTYSRDEIVLEYLRRHDSIDLVLCLTVREVAEPFSMDHRKPLTFALDVFAGDSGASSDVIEEMFAAALVRLPGPVRHPANAKHYVKRRSKSRFNADGIRGSNFGECHFNLSSRAVLDYVSGRIDRPQFERLVDDFALKVLRKGLEEGRLPVELKLNHDETKDDDTIVIRLGAPDPAVSPFRGVDSFAKSET